MKDEKISKEDLINLVTIEDEKDLTDEEILHLILDKKFSNNKIESKEKYTFGDKAADKLASFAGSWTFIIAFTTGLLIWILINNKLADKAFDPFPYILLNLILSCIAAIQAPVIMMSQNRQEKKDRQRALNDYRVNLKNEIIIQDMHKKLDKILENQKILKEKENNN